METAPANTQGTCFVVMGFGKKTDFETGRVLDLDMSYRNMIKPAVEAAGLRCIRADEIVHSGLIDVPMYEQLLNADVVVADLSTSNKNAFYELGVRHALRPFTTVVISEDGIKTFPFDVNHVAVRQYHHLGDDIGFGEAMRFRQLLTDAIVEIRKKDPRERDSPVYTFLNGLNPPALAATVQAAVQAAAREIGAKAGSVPELAAKANDRTFSFLMRQMDDAHGAKAGSAPESAPKANDQTHSLSMQQVDDAQKRGDFVTAKSLLAVIRGMIKAQAPNRPEDPYIIQRLALLTYKSGFPTEVGALEEARDLLAPLDPATSNDTETLGLWGSVHKRLWTLTKDMAQLDEAIRGYQRGFYLRNDYYNGINLAYLLNGRAAEDADPAEAIADFVQARRVRKEVLAICEQWLKTNPIPAAQSASPEEVSQVQKNRYWVLATAGEAHLGLGEEPEGQEQLEQAYAAAPAQWMADSTQKQIANLRLLLDKSPLKHIKADVPQG